jgi:hypothetical protein
VLNGFVHSVLDVDPRANVVLAGDFNDYQFSPSIHTLTDNGATLTDLINTLPPNEQYTYVFNGISQVLDHIFVTKPLADATPSAVEYQVIHVNSEFAAQASDHDPQVVRIQPLAATPITSGTLQVVPNRVLRGTLALGLLNGFEGKERLVIKVDGEQLATTTTDKHGRGIVLVPMPKRFGVGQHTMTATTPEGAVASATFTVVSLGGLRVF